MIIGAFLSSCSNSGNNAETGDAENVENQNSENTVLYETVKDGSILNWRASHLGGVQPRWGTVQLKSASISVNESIVTNATIEMDIASLSVDNFEDKESKTKLTGHLLSADFFKLETFPTAKFELTKMEKNNGDYNAKVTGNLTILDKTKSITFLANISVSESEVSVKSEDFNVDRTQWGLVYNVEGSVGVPKDYLIANEIGFTIDVKVSK